MSAHLTARAMRPAHPGAPAMTPDVSQEGPVVGAALLPGEEPDGGDLLRVETRGPQIPVAEGVHSSAS